MIFVHLKGTMTILRLKGKTNQQNKERRRNKYRTQYNITSRGIVTMMSSSKPQQPMHTIFSEISTLLTVGSTHLHLAWTQPLAQVQCLVVHKRECFKSVCCHMCKCFLCLIMFVHVYVCLFWDTHTHTCHTHTHTHTHTHPHTHTLIIHN